MNLFPDFSDYIYEMHFRRKNEAGGDEPWILRNCSGNTARTLSGS